MSLYDQGLSLARHLFTLSTRIMNVDEEPVIADGLLRAGTAVGAAIARNDLSEAQAKASEVKFWLDMALFADAIDGDTHRNLTSEAEEMLAALNVAQL